MADENPNPPQPETTAPPQPSPPVVVVEEVEPPPPSPPPSFTVTETETPHSPSISPKETFFPETPTPTPAPPPAPVPAPAPGSQEAAVMEPEKPNRIESKKVPESMVSFKEESSRVGDLSEIEKRALDELKQLVKEAIVKNDFITSPPPPPVELTEPSSGTPPPASVTETETQVAESQIVVPTTEITSSPEEISIWGVPFFKDERTDVILLKFLRARDFKVRDALTMLKNTIRWRKEFGIDALVDENLGDDLEKVVFMHGFDKEGHPVCYNVYGEFQNKELYQKTFSDEEKRTKFLRWRIQFLERSIRKLDFYPGGISTIFQVSDLKNSPGPAKRELRLATRQALQLLQDNYPEFVAKQVFINVPWWYLAFYTMINPFLTQRTKSKFVFASPARTAETLFKYVRPEHVPIQYGGLSVDYCDCNPEFTIDDPAAEITIKPATKQTVEIVVNERCFLVWELRVVGWEVSYSSEFVPIKEGGYTIIIQKTRKMTPTDEPVVSNCFKISELGKILLTVDNPTTKKKKLLYRFKVVPLGE